LGEDGRAVEHIEGKPVYRKLKHTLEAVREARKAQQEYIASTWREVEPIDAFRAAKPEYTPLQVAQGQVHAEIDRALRGNVPDDVSDKEIYDIVMEFRNFGFALTAFVKQELALRRAENYLADSGRAITTIYNTITLIKVLSVLRHLYSSVDDTLSRADFEEKSVGFLSELMQNKDSYNTVVRRTRNKYDNVLEHYTDDTTQQAIVFSKIILSKLGLKQRTVKVRAGNKIETHYAIVNVENARKFLRWRNFDDPHFLGLKEFTDAPIRGLIIERMVAFGVFENMPESDKKLVFGLMGDTTVFDVAVSIVVKKDNEAW
jgi:hypothetical protein